MLAAPEQALALTTTHTEVSRRRFLAAVATIALSGGGVAAHQALSPHAAWGETSAEVFAEAQRVLDRIEELEALLDIQSNEYYQALAEEEEAEAKMADAQRRIDEAQAKIEKLKARMATRVRGMYKGGNATFIDIVLGSTSFGAFVSNVQLLNQMNQADTETVEQTKELKALIQEEKAEYARQEAIAEAKRIEAENAIAEAKALMAELEEIHATLMRRGNELLRAEIEAERQRRLAEERARQEREEAERRAKEEAERKEREQQQQQQQQSGGDDSQGDDNQGGTGGGDDNQGGTGGGDDNQGGTGDDNQSGDDNSGDDNQGGGDDSGDDNGDDNGDDSGDDSGNDDEDEDDDTYHWTNTGNPIVDRAGQWIGQARYVWAACAPGQFDCSGLVSYAVTGAYRRIGTTWNFVTNTALFQPICGPGEWGNGGPRPGDIVVCHNNSLQHCGIYTGGAYMIHAASYDLGVIQGWFNRDVYSCVRYMG